MEHKTHPMTEETVSTAYERLVQRRRTFGSKAADETAHNNQENVEELPSMVLEEQPKTSLWDDDGSFQGLASDDEEEEEAEANCHDSQNETIHPVIDTEPNTQEKANDTKKDHFSTTKASDDDSHIPGDDSSEDGVGSDHDDADKDNNDEEEFMQDDNSPLSPSKSEDKSQSPTTNAAATLNSKEQEDNDDSSDEDEAPSLEKILMATDKLFDEVDDKGSVTVKQILERLGVPLNKATKKAVRQRLVELITAWQRQQEEEKSDESSKEDDSSDEEGDDGEEEASGEEEEEEIGGADDEYEPDARKPRASKAKRTRAVATKRTRRLASERTRRKKLNKSLQKSALRIQAEQLRKKRMQELRVRNEELQYESKDQERAEQIAAKFETQTDDQLRERLSNRVNLWQKLDQKRWNVLQAQPIIKPEPVETVQANKPEADPIDNTTDKVPIDDDHSSDSDSDDDLEITGPTKTLMVTRNSPKKVKRDVLSLLELSSPKLAGHRKEPAISPNRSLANLKRQLKSKHQKMGNLWLAQELGYKNEQEHIQDCVQLEERKRQLQLAREQERLKESELRQERLLQLGVNYEEEEEEQQSPPDDEESPENHDDEKPTDEDGEDEEIAMAREMGVLTSDSNPVDETSHLDEDEVESASKKVAGSVADDHDAVPAPPTDTSSVSASNQVDHEDGDGIRIAVNLVESKENSNIHSNDDSAEVTLAESTSNDDNDGEAHSDPGEDGEETQIGDHTETEPEKPKGPRNAAWKAMLKREEEKLKRLKKRGKGGLVEEEAEEEEEEEVAGLEDFGFKIHKKKNDDEEDEDNLPDDDEDMDDVVDELSDNEGDEDAGERARREQQKKEEKERHKEILRRMRDGYDGRRGGIAGGSARGIHRFDQLVAADNREDAKRLGLLNDDELDSDDEAVKKDSDDEEEDENALLDKMLKDRFLHRSSVEVEEDFSGDEEDDEKESGDGEHDDKQTEEEREQERLAKRFSKRARMQRLIDAHGHDEEFSRSKLIDDDEMIKADLQRMKVRRSRPYNCNYLTFLTLAH